MGDGNDETKKPSSDWADNSGYSHIELYPNGNYKSFVPEIDTEWAINDHHVKLKADVEVSFYPDGTLKKCVLCTDATLTFWGASVPIAADRTLEFHADGNVRRLTVARESGWRFWRSRTWTYRGKTYDPDTDLEFSDDGAVVASTRAGKRGDEGRRTDR